MIIIKPSKPFSVAPDNDAIFLVGYEVTSPVTYEGVIQKFNDAGTSQFITTFTDRIGDVAVHTNGDYCITSQTVDGTVWFRKYLSNNTLDWSLSSSDIVGHKCKFNYYGEVFISYFTISTSDYSYRKYSNSGSLLLTKDNVPGNVIAVDKYQNVYIGGNTTLRKYNSSGTLLFTLSFPDDFGDNIEAITTDINANFYFTCGSLASNDTFKYDPDGNLIWSKNHGGDDVRGIAVDKNSNVFTTGDIVSNVTTRKYNSSGTLQWSVGAGWGSGTDIKADNDGNILISQTTTETDVQLRKISTIDGSEIYTKKLNTSGVWYATAVDIQHKSLVI